MLNMVQRILGLIVLVLVATSRAWDADVDITRDGTLDGLVQLLAAHKEVFTGWNASRSR
jgi:hypothetical protein